MCIMCICMNTCRAVLYSGCYIVFYMYFNTCYIEYTFGTPCSSLEDFSLLRVLKWIEATV